MNTERQKDENVVVLDCENLTSSIVTEDTVFGVIHKQLLDKLTEQISESVRREKQKEAKKKTDSFIRESRRDDNFPFNYFITGKRGSGKTTFLKQVVEKLENGGHNDITLKFLHWYDPSQSFGVPADFFIEVAAAIKTKVEEFSENTKRYSPKYDDVLMLQSVMQKLDKAIVRFSQEREALSGLSEHRAANLRINDPEMNKEIKKNFEECMKLLCGLYGVDAFVLVIDDIDIRTEQCYNVLENLRLFISNEYLTVLMAGDRTINIERIRERFFKEYDYKYHRCDEQGKEERLSYIVSHAAQYFAKLFPVKQQFELRSLYTLSHKRNRVRIELKINNAHQNPSLEDWLKDLFHIAISINDSEANSHVDTFMSLPLRNIIQILEYWVREGILDKLDQLNAKDSDAEKTKQLREQIEFLVRTALNRSLHDQLPDLSYNYEKLDSDDGRAYYALLLRLCQDTGDLEHGFYLSDEIERGSKYRYLTLVLAANFKRHVKDLKGFLSYLCYGPASVALYAQALEQYKQAAATGGSTFKTEKDLRKSFEEYLHIGNWRNASRWARHANMIWCYDPDNYSIHSGVVRIQDPGILKKMGRYAEKASQDLDILKKTVALLVSMNKSDGRDNNYYISIYSYIAYILRCIEICDEIYSLDTNNLPNRGEAALDEMAKQYLLNLTEEYFPISSCRRPEWQLGVPEGEGHDGRLWIGRSILLNKEQKENTQGYDEPVNEKADSLMGEIVKWYKELRDAQKTSSTFLDNITPNIMGILWSELYNFLRTLSNLSVQKDGKKNTQKSSEKKPGLPKYIGWFNAAARLFSRYMESIPQTGRITRFYRKKIGEFPLTEYFNLYDILIPSAAKKPAATKKSAP